MNLATVFQPIGDVIALGGPVVALLLLVSVAALALIIVKLVQFAREGVGRHGRAAKAVGSWRNGHTHDALRQLEPGSGAVDLAVRTAMELMLRTGASTAEAEEEVRRIATMRLHGLQRGFRALEAIAQIAPLLGLFGTVLGMITAFQELQAAGNAVDPSALAGGIWVALLTTAVGLAVAMPVSLVLTFFESRIENERVAIETLAGAVLSKIVPIEPGASPIAVQRLTATAEAAHAARG